MIILLEKLMLALKAMKDWVERELKKISGNVDATKDSLSAVENNLSTVQSNLNMVEDILINKKMDKRNPAGTGSFSLNRRSGTTIGINSVAMGVDCTASGGGSHAEGKSTIASGNGSHAEGESTIAYGNGSHAEGESTIAYGENSHAEGESTIVNGKAQHVQGEYNIEDVVINQHGRGKYAHIVGNGTRDARSNAHTLDWNGVGWFAGGLKVGGTGQDDTTAKEVATKDYVDNSTVETKSYTDVAIAALVNSAPETLDTLGELATAFEENADMVATLDAAVTNKAEKAELESAQDLIEANAKNISSMQTALNKYSTETWTFTLDNGSTVTKKMVILS